MKVFFLKNFIIRIFNKVFWRMILENVLHLISIYCRWCIRSGTRGYNIYHYYRLAYY